MYLRVICVDFDSCLDDLRLNFGTFWMYGVFVFHFIIYMYDYFRYHQVGERVSEWVIVVSNFSALSWQEQVDIQWDDDEVRFVLAQHA
jgi:hypothetical protein